ncbi:MAG: hypothetical protein ABFD54_09180 [Armatimonadota bacterium]
MTASWSKDQLLDEMRQYTTLLEAKNAALADLSATSIEMWSTLSASESADISDVLRRREQHCKRCVEASNRIKSSSGMVEIASQAAETVGGELGDLSQKVLALYNKSQTLSEEILTRQQQCEAILKARLDDTAKALRQSVQRRKLDAAYGPAHKHGTPIFLDRQR